MWMAPSAADDFPLPHVSDNDLKPFFVLHKGSPCQKVDRRSSGKTGRKVDLSSSLPTGAEADVSDGQKHENLRMKAFHNAWLKIQSIVKDVLRNINVDIFNEIDNWVQKSFGTICSCGTPDPNKATCSYPITIDVTTKQLFTGLVLMRSMEFVDDLQTFADLGIHLNSRYCHVASLSSVDFSAKNGLSVCLRSLSRQLLEGSNEAADISVLASWYIEQDNFRHPVVIIIEDMDRCNGPVLSDFILMLSEWVIKIPIILIMGVATTFDAPRNILSSKAVQHLSSFKFFLGSPANRLDAIIEAILVKPCSGFIVSHNVAAFIRNCFMRQDGTLTSLVRALKMAMVQHFLMEPLSFTINGLFDEETEEAPLAEAWRKQSLDLPSCTRKLLEPNSDMQSHGASEIKKLQNLWSIVVLCLYEAGKNQKTTLLDLYHEALDPKLYNSRHSDHLGVEPDSRRPLENQFMHARSCSLRKGGFIDRTIRQVRDLPEAAFFQLLEKWEKQTEGINEIHRKVKELRLQAELEDNLKGERANTSKKQTTQSIRNLDKGVRALNEKAAALITCMARDYMQPIECIAFHEIVCFKNVDKLQSALMGDPRRRIQLDLLECHNFLKCTCCSKSCNVPVSSLHDTTIMYTLAQEHGDLINLHDWYQSFRAIIIQQNVKGRNRSKLSPSPKKRKTTSEPQETTEASVMEHQCQWQVQRARFCRAVIELQITGLLRMPSKRRPDYVQRVAFGL